MADDNSWLERQRRMIKCKKHGLHYDPKMSSGCALCAREAAKQIPRRAPQLTLILLCVLGMMIALYQIFGVGAKGADAFDLTRSESEDTPAAAVARLDPELYREAIENLEAAVHRPAVATSRELPAAGIRIADAAHELSEAIARRQPRDGAAASAALSRLGTTADRKGFSLPDLRQARIDWQRIRARHFEPADWYGTPGQGGSEEQRIQLADYRDVASELIGLIAEASAEMATRPSSGEEENGWKAYASGWRQRLGEAWRRLPSSAPVGVENPQVLLAIQKLERAFRSAESAVQTADAAGLAEALDLAEEARRGIESPR